MLWTIFRFPSKKAKAHLDIAMTEWLEKYLQEFKGGLLAVSHDRAFLDNIATRILEMEGGHLTSFKGNYSKYLVQKELQTATLEAAYASQQDYIARTTLHLSTIIVHLIAVFI